MDHNDLGGVLLVNVKRIFMDFDIDCEYAIVLAYRMVRGDTMISQMWEPHQTSAFLNAIFIKLYLLLTGTTTGIALYLNAIGMFVRLNVMAVFYRTFRKYSDRTVLFLICSFFLTVNAKYSIILDFSNLMIYFSVLMLCALFTCLCRQKENASYVIYLILSAVCLCFEVVSYPSTIILFPLMLLVINHYSLKKKWDIALFSCVCIGTGCAYIMCLMLPIGWERFWYCIREIVTGDDSHRMSDMFDKVGVYGTDIKNMLLIIFCCAVLAFAIVKVCLQRKANYRKEWYIKAFFVLMFIFYFGHIFLKYGNDAMLANMGWVHLTVYFPILILAYCLRGYCSKQEKMGFCIGMIISMGSCVAVLLLTNLTFLTTAEYLILGIMVSMMPIGAYLRQSSVETAKLKIYGMLVLFVAIVIFRNIYLVRSIARFRVSIFEVNNVVKDGPLLGIFSDYMGPHIVNCNMEDWKDNVRSGDRILLVTNGSTVGYLYEDTEICIDSTISTPTYNEKLLRYWALNPWKEPNVVIVDSWFVELEFSEDSWIMQWIDENFDSYTEGRFVRFYRRE